MKVSNQNIYFEMMYYQTSVHDATRTPAGTFHKKNPYININGKKREIQQNRQLVVLVIIN